MKILITSYAYSPNVGGIERVSEIVYRGLLDAGHDVRLLTETKSIGRNEPGVFRQPSLLEIFRQMKWCQVHLQSNVSLRYLLVALLLGTPTLIVFHTWVRRANNNAGCLDILKLVLSRQAGYRYAVSKALAQSIGKDCKVIENPYDGQVFKPDESSRPVQKILFVGRLIHDKGVDIAIDAITQLRSSGINATLTIVGDGPHRPELQDQATRRNVEDHISFLGELDPASVANEMRNHLALVVTSRWDEPFGLIVVEAQACGTLVIASRVGGLPEAAGQAALYFERNSVSGLVEKIHQVLRMSDQELVDRRAAGLKNAMSYEKNTVLRRYSELLTSIIQ